MRVGHDSLESQYGELYKQLYKQYDPRNRIGNSELELTQLVSLTFQVAVIAPLLPSCASGR